MAKKNFTIAGRGAPPGFCFVLFFNVIFWGVFFYSHFFGDGVSFSHIQIEAKTGHGTHKCCDIQIIVRHHKHTFQNTKEKITGENWRGVNRIPSGGGGKQAAIALLLPVSYLQNPTLGNKESSPFSQEEIKSPTKQHSWIPMGWWLPISMGMEMAHYHYHNGGTDNKVREGSCKTTNNNAP